MINSFYYHSISPKQVIRGEHAWEEGLKIIPSICQSPLLIGRSKATLKIRESLYLSLLSTGIQVRTAELEYDCCEVDIERLKEYALEHSCDGIIPAGGGKVLDAGKLVANELNIPCITVPLSAATCAGWTALGNIYSPEGAFERDVLLDCCPRLLIFDHNFIRSAPNRTLASGIADALAKWYEASLSSDSSKDGLVQQAVQMARVLRDQLLINSEKAFKDSKSEEWKTVVEGCALTAGLIGGIGGSRCRTAAAHALHNGLTQLRSCDASLHGEIVGFGILVQLRLEEKFSSNQLANQSRIQLLKFLKKFNLPVSLEELGLEKVSLEELLKACIFACKDTSEMHLLPFEVNPKELLEALTGAGEESHPVLISQNQEQKL